MRCYLGPMATVGTALPLAPVRELDEAAARRTLRAQIAKLERELGNAVCSAYPRIELTSFAAGFAGPRLLGIAELEALRDELSDRLKEVRTGISHDVERQSASRLLIERMLLDPGRYKWVRVTGADIGENVCKSWHVRPRLGIVGMMMGWWQVKISSGCPLARGLRPPPADGQAISEAHPRGRRAAPQA